MNVAKGATVISNSIPNSFNCDCTTWIVDSFPTIVSATVLKPFE